MICELLFTAKFPKRKDFKPSASSLSPLFTNKAKMYDCRNVSLLLCPWALSDRLTIIYYFFQAIRISPDSEIYKESLAILQMSYFPSEQQGVSYASVTRPKLDQDDGQDYISSYEWKTETRKTKDNPNKTSWSSTLSSSCHDVGHEQSSIENPWASFVKRNSRRKKSPRSPIDGISEIEIPPGNDDFYSGSPSYQDKENTPISTNNSQKGTHADERSVGHTQEPVSYTHLTLPTNREV